VRGDRRGRPVCDVAAGSTGRQRLGPQALRIRIEAEDDLRLACGNETDQPVSEMPTGRTLPVRPD
jgi:hypothetical protein